MNTQLFKSMLAVGALALLLAGCGGGDDTTSLTKSQFIKQADAICKKADEEQVADLARVEKELTGQTKGPNATDENQEKLIVDGGMPAVQKQAEEIAALGAPEGSEDEVDAIVTATEEGVVKAEEDPLGPLENFFAEADKLSKAFGLEECAETL